MSIPSVMRFMISFSERRCELGIGSITYALASISAKALNSAGSIKQLPEKPRFITGVLRLRCTILVMLRPGRDGDAPWIMEEPYTTTGFSADGATK